MDEHIVLVDAYIIRLVGNSMGKTMDEYIFLVDEYIFFISEMPMRSPMRNTVDDYILFR